MIKLIKIQILSILMLVTIFSCNYQSNTETVDIQKIEAEVKDVIASTLNFFQTRNIEDAKAVFSDDAVLIGTDEAEYLTGWEEIEPSIIAQLAVIKDAKFDTRDLNVTISSSGEMAAYTSVIDFSFTAGGQPASIENVRYSGVIKKIDDVWKTTQVHWSIGLAGQAVEY
ncbi:nuclear transport factor 2 family protein [Flavobacteriaceae bacterium]|jgi:ketosteroid isomerase-like protein|nr:nuclear transport factor 2 family protein [Flavobacteriaceae bacterium]